MFDPGPLAFPAAHPAQRPFLGGTVRNVVRLSLGGSAVRVRVSNRFGREPLVVAGATVAASSSDGELAPDTLVPLRLQGSERFVLAAGQTLLTDPAALQVASGQHVAVSLFIEGAVSMSTMHASAFRVNYASPMTDETRTPGVDALPARPHSWYFMDGVDVLALQTVRGVIVAAGDSLTDGMGVALGGHGRWPERLARRLEARGDRFGVVNAGISGNRLHSDSPAYGSSLLTRWEDDVLSRTGVSHAICLIGINDLSGPWEAHPYIDPPARPAHLLIGDFRTLIGLSHARGVRVIGATVMPGDRFGPVEEERQRLNRWIRQAEAFDGVIDFDAAVADPAARSRLLTRYSFDGLHLNEAGYQAMADAIDLSLFTHRRPLSSLTPRRDAAFWAREAAEVRAS